MLLTLSETWNGVKLWRLPFRFVKVLSAPSACRIRIGSGGKLEEDLGDCQAGDWHRAAEGQRDYDILHVTNTGSQAVVLRLADGLSGSDGVVGNVDIADDATRLLGIVYGNAGQLAQLDVGGVNALQVVDRGYKYGASYASVTSLTAASPVAIVAPGSNVNGIIVWDAGIWGYAASISARAILAKSSAPASVVDGDVIAASQASAGILLLGASQATPQFVAAGKGLYAFTEVNESSGYRYIKYTVL